MKRVSILCCLVLLMNLLCPVGLAHAGDIATPTDLCEHVWTSDSIYCTKCGKYHDHEFGHWADGDSCVYGCTICKIISTSEGTHVSKCSEHDICVNCGYKKANMVVRHLNEHYDTSRATATQHVSHCDDCNKDFWHNHSFQCFNLGDSGHKAVCLSCDYTCTTAHYAPCVLADECQGFECGYTGSNIQLTHVYSKYTGECIYCDAVNPDFKPLETEIPEEPTTIPTDKPEPTATSVPTVTPNPATKPDDTDAPVTDAPVTDAPATDVPVTDAPPTDAPVTDAPATDAPATDVPVTDAPVTDAPVTDAPVTDAPVTDAPVTDVPVTDAPVTDVPVTDVPVTDAPVTDAPVTDAPVTDAPVTDVPVTDAPATDVPTTDVPVTDAPVDDAPATDVPATDVPVDDVPAEEPAHTHAWGACISAGNGTHSQTCLDCNEVTTANCTMADAKIGTLDTSACIYCGYTTWKQVAADATVQEGKQDSKPVENATFAMLDADGAAAPVAENITLVVYEAQPEATIELDTGAKVAVKKALTIALLEDNAPITLTSAVKLNIPVVEEEMTGLKLLVMDENGELVEIEYEIIDGVMTFETEILGIFLLVEEI